MAALKSLVPADWLPERERGSGLQCFLCKCGLSWDCHAHSFTLLQWLEYFCKVKQNVMGYFMVEGEMVLNSLDIQPNNRIKRIDYDHF